jgi:hypothetical protein
MIDDTDGCSGGGTGRGRDIDARESVVTDVDRDDGRDNDGKDNFDNGSDVGERNGKELS